MSILIEGKYVLGICIGVFLTGFAIGAMTEYFNHLDEPCTLCIECNSKECTAEFTGETVRIPKDPMKFIGDAVIPEEQLHEKQIRLLEKIYCLEQLYAHNNKDLCDTS